MVSITISEATQAQLTEVRKGHDEFDSATTDDELVAWLASEVVTTQDEVEAEQARLRRKFGHDDSDGSDVELDRRKGTTGRDDTELTESEQKTVKAKQEKLRQKYLNR